MAHPRAGPMLALAVTVWAAPVGPAAAESDLRIGVTLRPYYSWVASIADGAATVVPVLPEDADPHSYQPRPADLAAFGDLDAIVVNGLGHDAFVDSMLASTADPDLHVIHANAETALVAGPTGAANSHTFLSLTIASQQVRWIAGELARLDPDNGTTYQANARLYVRTLRGILADGLDGIRAIDPSDVTIATVHDGYGYLFDELGLDIDAVIQPRHGIDPSPRQLADTIDRLNAADVDILFVEADYGDDFAAIVEESTGARLAQLSHVSRGPFDADLYADSMADNVRRIVDAVLGAVEP